MYIHNNANCHTNINIHLGKNWAVLEFLEMGHYVVQGDPNQNLRFLLARTLKICVSDPMLVKPKCV